jgi:hypothetical protein
MERGSGWRFQKGAWRCLVRGALGRAPCREMESGGPGKGLFMLRDELLAEVRAMTRAERIEVARDLVEVGLEILEECAREVREETGDGTRWKPEDLE